MTEDAEYEMPKWGAIVAELLRQPASHILAVHVPEIHRGAARGLKKAAAAMGIDVQDLNPAYAGRDRPDPEEFVEETFPRGAVRIVFLTGWGSDPKAADRMLAVVHPYVAKNPNLRLVAMNNASPIPPMFRSSGPTAHPDGPGFKAHVARLLAVTEDVVTLVDVGAVPERAEDESEDLPFTDEEIEFIVGKAAMSSEAQKMRLVDLVLSAGNDGKSTQVLRTPSTFRR